MTSSCVFVNFEQILRIALLFQLLTLNKKILAGYSFDKIPFLEIVYAVDNQPQNVVTDNSCRKGNENTHYNNRICMIHKI